ncbi:MAG: MotA/TolQ/ExbB proton channel family protein [Kiritimatiellae bacterium]|nr:MotA/TolQ/ExbB proton channel family protein [Kiritimatiellia bacterium]
MISWLNLGGWPAWLAVGIGIVAVAVSVERWLFLRRARVPLDDFLRGIFNVLERGNIAEGVALCDDTPGPVARMVRAALLRLADGPAAAREAMVAAGTAEIPRLECRVRVPAAAARLAALSGLLGTVLALINAGQRIELRAPLVYAGDLAAAMWQALVCTAIGLAVAIPCWAAHQLLVAMVESVLVDMEDALRRVTERVERGGAPPAGRVG